jgi:hypothetical protein
MFYEFRQEEGVVVPAEFRNKTENSSRPKQKKK